MNTPQNAPRRQFLATAAAGVSGILASELLPQFLAQAQAAEKTADPAHKALLLELAKTASECIRTGEACAAHCQRELAAKNTSMANCDLRVREMLALTRAMLTLASSQSALAAKLAPVCAEACKTCAEACAEHREHFSHGMHLECKECWEACQACEKACRKLSA